MADDETPGVVIPEQGVPVRETRTLFRLTPSPETAAGGFSRQTAIVAADTEDEARRLAALHDPFGRDWRDPSFATAEARKTEEDHVFGDVVFRSEPGSALVEKRHGARRA